MKKTKTQKGITLIALIITIIVLLILAVVAISAVQESDIIVKAKDATKQYAIAEEKEQITLAYTKYILDKRTSENATLEVPGATVTGTAETGLVVEFEKTGNSYSVSSDGKVELIEDEAESGSGQNPEQPGDGSESGDGEETDTSIVHGDIIPTGGVYKRIAEDGTETTYDAGDAFPEMVLDGDIYIYEDYEYRYNYVCFALSETPTWMDVQSINQALAEEGINLPTGGWGVRVIDATKEAYTDMITTINGQDVTNLFCTYTACTSLTSIPKLSDKTKDITYGFAVCMALTEVSNLPDSITNMMSAFNSCSSLTTVSDLPDNVTNLSHTFDQCSSLTTVPAIPSGVTNMKRTFGCCSSLGTVDISQAVNIANMYGTFEECDSLTGEIEINANPSEYKHCFAKTKKTITIVGTALDSTKDALAKTGTSESNVSWE